jgi:hypothetical protein
MPKKEHLLISTILLLGFFDWLTTISGIVFFKATETNPLMAGLTQTNLLLFSSVKLLAITITGLALYKATILSKLKVGELLWAKRLLNSGFSAVALMLAAAVTCNAIAIMGF